MSSGQYGGYPRSRGQRGAGRGNMAAIGNTHQNSGGFTPSYGRGVARRGGGNSDAASTYGGNSGAGNYGGNAASHSSGSSQREYGTSSAYFVRDEDPWSPPESPSNSNVDLSSGFVQKQENRNPPGRYEAREFRPSKERFSKAGGDSHFRTTEVLEVEQSKVGRIIGKGGSKIRELQDNSGARIQVDRNDTGDKKSVTLTGSKEEIELARTMIEALTMDVAWGNRNYDNRNEGGNNQRYGRNEKRDYGDEYSDEEDKPWHPEGQIELTDLPELIKDLYNEDPTVAQMTAKQVAEIRKQNMDISVVRLTKEGKVASNIPIPNPILKFEHAFKDYPEILNQIKKQGFEHPTPIQSQAWPVLLSGNDLIGIAQTGTGKTLAFLLPAMIHIESQPTPRSERLGPTVLIITPTRELALQIEHEMNKYSYKGMKSVCVYGGADRKEQSRLLSKKPEIVVGTPGRLTDFIKTGELQMASVSYLVLDEADKMLEMGFEPQINKTVIWIREDRQVVLTSATWPSDVRSMAFRFTTNPVQVVVGSLDLTAVHSVKQCIDICDEKEKLEKLFAFLNEMTETDKVIVFCGKKATTDFVSCELALQKVDCQSIHGDRCQSDREQALQEFRDGRVQILIATDVASRGIDIPDVTHIFNMDFPRNIEEYVHRVGRTGRAGKTGTSITLFTRDNWAHAKELIKILEEADQVVPDQLRAMAQRYENRPPRNEYGGGRRFGGGGRGRDRDHIGGYGFV